MANNQDHVWHILRDVLELLAGSGIPTPERGYALDGGWSLALSDLRRLVNDRNALRAQIKTAIAERDQLRAELAAAKERGDGLYLGLRQTLEALGGVAQPGVSEAFLILGVPGEAAAIKRLNTALAADNARLRAAAELGECYMKVFRHEIARNNETFEGSEDQAEVDGDLAKVQAALAATPAQSLAARDAALLRSLAAKLDGEGHPANEYYRNWLRAEADRIEKEAKSK